jgi:hypothetical protein
MIAREGSARSAKYCSHGEANGAPTREHGERKAIQQRGKGALADTGPSPNGAAKPSLSPTREPRSTRAKTFHEQWARLHQRGNGCYAASVGRANRRGILTQGAAKWQIARLADPRAAWTEVTCGTEYSRGAGNALPAGSPHMSGHGDESAENDRRGKVPNDSGNHAPPPGGR